MRRAFIVAGILLGMLLILQFFQPERNLGNDETAGDMLTLLPVPDSVAFLLKNSCYDCHSNSTSYPWYSRISPLSWYLNKHITGGKDALNFSEYASWKKSTKIGALSEICEVVESGAMPLQSYLVIHRNAKLDDQEVERICTWAESESLRILQTGTSAEKP